MRERGRLGATMKLSRSVVLVLGGVCLAGAPARADKIRNPTAVFAGLDKITGRITAFDVAIDETVQFGTLQITPRVCLTRPATEAPLTEGFVEVDDVDSAKNAKRIFSGWMFAASPGLHGVEHPVYDVWLKDCVGGKEVIASPAATGPDAGQPAPPNAAPAANGVSPNKARRTIEPQEPVEPTVESLPPSSPDVAPDSTGPAPDAAVPAPDAAAPAPAPTAPVDGLGAPIEVGPPPGARRPADGAAAPADDGFGEPVEVGPPPGAPDAAQSGAEPGSQPVAPKPPKRKRKPPTDPNVLPDGGTAPPADIPPPARAPRQQPQPSSPQDLLKNLPFFH